MLSKITVGFVVQVWNEETNKWVSQNFVAGDEVNWENEAGEPVDVPECDPYLPFDMVQPE